MESEAMDGKGLKACLSGMAWRLLRTGDMEFNGWIEWSKEYEVRVLYGLTDSIV
jgi:hypothetical protein